MNSHKESDINIKYQGFPPPLNLPSFREKILKKKKKKIPKPNLPTDIAKSLKPINSTLRASQSASAAIWPERERTGDEYCRAAVVKTGRHARNRRTHLPIEKGGKIKRHFFFGCVCVLNAQAVLCCEANAVALPPLYRSSLII